MGKYMHMILTCVFNNLLKKCAVILAALIFLLTVSLKLIGKPVSPLKIFVKLELDRQRVQVQLKITAQCQSVKMLIKEIHIEKHFTYERDVPCNQSKISIRYSKKIQSLYMSFQLTTPTKKWYAIKKVNFNSQYSKDKMGLVKIVKYAKRTIVIRK